jgi:hypothetical protein
LRAFKHFVNEFEPSGFFDEFHKLGAILSERLARFLNHFERLSDLSRIGHLINDYFRSFVEDLIFNRVGVPGLLIVVEDVQVL